MDRSETGITDTGESPDPVNRKTRRMASGWQADSRQRIGDGDLGGLGSRTGQQRPGQNFTPPAASAKKRRKGMR